MPLVATGASRPAEAVNALSVDVEDYFHVSAFARFVSRASWDGLESRVCANTGRLLQLLDDAGARATFFVLGWVADRFPGLVRRIVGAGHEIASHGYAHRLVYDMSPEEFRADLRKARATLERAASVPVHGYRAPSYSITPRSLWAFDVLVEEGYLYDSSVFPIRHDRYGFPGWPRHAALVRREGGCLWEIPPATLRLAAINLPVAGGGYFRILPYGLTRWGMARINRREQRPALFYIHPWEIDPDQPRLGATGLTRLRHYWNLERTEPRLRRLLREFTFVPIVEAFGLSSLQASVAPLEEVV